MDIKIFKKTIDGMIKVNLTHHEVVNKLGKTVDITVWVPENDSMAALEQAARTAAIAQVRRTLSALDAEDHQQQSA